MTLAFDRTGAGEPLILIHGLGSRRQIWAPVIPALSERHDVVAFESDFSVGGVERTSYRMNA